MCFEKQCSCVDEAHAFLRSPKVASEDFTVYKRLKIIGLCYPLYYSPHMSFNYRPGELAVSDFDIDVYVYKDLYIEAQVMEGLHSYKTKERAFEYWTGCETFEFIVPKGARYYENDHEIVSNQLMMKNPVICVS